MARGAHRMADNISVCGRTNGEMKSSLWSVLDRERRRRVLRATGEKENGISHHTR